MSYILDALKKAESERKLGAIPNVYAQPTPSTTVSADAPGWTARLPWLFSLLMLAILLTGIAWLQPWRVRPAPAPDLPRSATAPTSQVASNSVQRAPAPANVAAFSAVSDAASDASVSKVDPAALHPATKNTYSPPINLPKPIAAAPLAAEPVLPISAQEDPHVKPNPAAPETSPPEEKPVGTLQDLPEDIQRELPAIVVNGYIYAKNPADRSILINKRLLHEGDQVGPNIVLEKMTPKGAVLNYKGYHYRVGY